MKQNINIIFGLNNKKNVLVNDICFKEKRKKMRKKRKTILKDMLRNLINLQKCK